MRNIYRNRGNAVYNTCMVGSAVYIMEYGLEEGLRFIVRLATLGDLDALLRFYVSMWQVTYEGLIDASFLARLTTNPMVRESYHTMLAPWRTDIKILLMFDADRIIGMAAGGPYRSVVEEGHAENYALYIDPAYQGRGLGRKLWLQRARLLQEQGAKVLHTWVLEPNTAARATYLAWGARPAEPWARTVQFGQQTMNEVHYMWDISTPGALAALTAGDE